LLPSSLSREESIIPIVPEAERINLEKDRQKVIEDFIATAPVADVVPEVFPEVSPDNKGRRRKLVGACLLVILIATVIGVVLGVKLRPEAASSPDYEALLFSISSDGGEALRNSSTAQYKAFDWTVTNIPNLTASFDKQIFQRYSLATLFFSTNGDSWYEKAGWLSEPEECTWWYGLECTSSGAVSELDGMDSNAHLQVQFLNSTFIVTILTGRFHLRLDCCLSLVSLLWNPK
jgi:hypothetical protein